MNLKKKLAFFCFGSVAVVLSIGFSACTNSSPTPQATGGESPAAEMDNSQPMPGMDHSEMSMNLGPKNETFDLRFIDGMVPHHEGGVAMAQEVLQKSNRPELKQLAQEMIDAQEQEISELKSWRQSWYPNASAEPIMYHAQMKHDMPMSEEMRSSMMMSGDLGAADDQFDLRFINAMIPHHQGAIEMAKQVLENSDRPEMKTLAQNMIDSQQQEIDQLNQWKQQWYGQ